jgi:NAD(P)-dependent dehydrogenase (short-subunit alcohol dehydrogenase family)
MYFSISSSAGLTGFEYCTAYSASKFGLEGWMESLQAEVEPFGIQTMVVNPGFFRTELLTENSTNYANTSIEDYKERNAQQHAFWKEQNGKQSGEPARLAQALITLTSQKELPVASLLALMPLVPQGRRWPCFSNRSTHTVSCQLPSHTKTHRRKSTKLARLTRSSTACCSEPTTRNRK